ncbi:MAG: aspartyl protease family protein [Planctomycetes bacterium]|nr:aspartyl protease family protein [Planctomycetota bacterium]
MRANAMGRVRTDIRVNGRKLWTLFDSGSRNTYITKRAARGLDVKDWPQELSVALGGKVHKVRRSCLLRARLEGRWIETLARIVDKIGPDEDGTQIDVLFGALAMQEWGIRLDMENEKLDLSRYTTNFVEF